MRNKKPEKKTPAAFTALDRRHVREARAAAGKTAAAFRRAGKAREEAEKKETRLKRFMRKNPRAARVAKWVAWASAALVAVNAPAMYLGYGVFGGLLTRKYTTLAPEYAMYESCRAKVKRHEPCAQKEVEAIVGPVMDNNVGMASGYGLGGSLEYFLGVGRLFKSFMPAAKTGSAASPARTPPAPRPVVPVSSALSTPAR